MRTLRLYAVRTLGALSSSFLASFGFSRAPLRARREPLRPPPCYGPRLHP